MGYFILTTTTTTTSLQLSDKFDEIHPEVVLEAREKRTAMILFQPILGDHPM